MKSSRHLRLLAALLITLSGICALASQERDLTLTLADGKPTAAKLAWPDQGNGPWPAILLLPGSGPADMDVTMTPQRTSTGKTEKVFKQLADFLAGCGFATLRYHKRGIIQSNPCFEVPVRSEERDGAHFAFGV